MRIFFLILASATLASTIYTADVRQKLIVTAALTPPPTPPHHSPHLGKKSSSALRATADGLSSLPAEAFALDATEISVQTNTGKKENLQGYLHHRFYEIYEEFAAIREQLKAIQQPPVPHPADTQPDLEKISSVQEQRITTQLQEQQKQIDALRELCTKTSIPQNSTIQVAVDENRTLPLNEAYQRLEQKIEGVESRLIEELEGPKQEEESYATWFRRVLDYTVASSLIAAGFYHSHTLMHIATKAATLTMNPMFATALHYAYIPTGLLFTGLLATDMWHNLNGATYGHHRQAWRAYFVAHKWHSPKPSDFLVTSAVIIKVLANSISNVITPALRMLIDTGTVNVILAAGAAIHFKTWPKAAF